MSSFEYHDIKADAAGIGIPASDISVRYRYRSILVPDWIRYFRYRTGSDSCILFHSGTGLTGCRTVWHSGIYMRTPCTSLLLVVERHIRASMLLLVDRKTFCTSIYTSLCGVKPTNFVMLTNQLKS
jgi:hypothetical protein